jgi:hypothetical protein
MTTGAVRLSPTGYSITAVYSGDNNFCTSTSSALIQTVNKADSSTTARASVNPAVFGQSVTFTAIVAAALPGRGTPTGTVTFNDGMTTIPTATFSGGRATSAATTLSAGAHSITVVYGGDALFNASTSPALIQLVFLKPPIVTVRGPITAVPISAGDGRDVELALDSAFQK